MAGKYLSREEAPISPETWQLLDETMINVVKSALTGRRLVRVEGPFGLGLKGIPLADPKLGELALTTGFIPLSYIHKTFTMAKRDLAAFERDHLPLDLGEVVATARLCARLEDGLVFSGDPSVPGLLSVTGCRSAISAWTEVGQAAEDIINAITQLDSAGFHGPYAVALPPARYNRLLRLYPAGYTSELDHMKTIAADGIFKAGGLEGEGVVISSGQQIASIVLGQDMTVGFIGPTEERLEFSISESLALLVREPRAICVLGG